MSKESALASLTTMSAPVESQATIGPSNPPPQPQAAPQQLRSSEFSAFAKKETEIVRAREQLRLEKEQIASQKEELKGIYEKYNQYEQTKAKDPIAALKQLGFSETDVLNYLASGDESQLTPEQVAAKTAAEIADSKIKEFQDSQTKLAQEEAEKRNLQTINEYKSDLGRVLELNREKFPLSAHYGKAAQDLAFDTVVQILNDSQGQDPITHEEALELVESYYDYEFEEMSTIRGKRAPAQEPLPAELQPKAPERTRTVTPSDPNNIPKPTITRTRTLSNQVGASMSSMRPITNETREAKKERLINALKNGKL